RLERRRRERMRAAHAAEAGRRRLMAGCAKRMPSPVEQRLARRQPVSRRRLVVAPQRRARRFAGSAFSTRTRPRFS
ncbi:hypothetical protein ACX83E_25690, partial [Burkholderia pseudomallei]